MKTTKATTSDKERRRAREALLREDYNRELFGRCLLSGIALTIACTGTCLYFADTMIAIKTFAIIALIHMATYHFKWKPDPSIRTIARKNQLPGEDERKKYNRALRAKGFWWGAFAAILCFSACIWLFGKSFSGVIDGIGAATIALVVSIAISRYMRYPDRVAFLEA